MQGPVISRCWKDCRRTGCDKCVLVEVVKIHKARSTAPICKHEARASDRAKTTFEAILGNPKRIQVDLCCLKTTRDDIEREMPVIDEADEQSVPTLVLKDAFHLMDYISVSERHGIHKEFMARFRDALFLINEEDKRKDCCQIMEQNNLTWDNMSKHRSSRSHNASKEWIPPANQLFSLIKALFIH